MTESANTQPSMFFQSGPGLPAFSLVRSAHRRTVEIQIRPSGEVRVRAPRYVSEAFIRNFIAEKSDWILRKVRQQKDRPEPVATVAFKEGAEFMFLGRTYPLTMTATQGRRPEISFDGTRWLMALPEGLPEERRAGVIRRQMIGWYKNRAGELAKERVDHFRLLMGEGPVRMVVKTQKRIWGSCYAHKRTVYLNWQIVMAPPEVMDYVVVHELSHLAVPNHSKRFWRQVARFVPDYKEKNRWLRLNAVRMRWPQEGKLHDRHA